MQEEFLSILRTTKQTVFIMSAEKNDIRRAVTVSSVTSLSLDPPMIIVCINKNASIHQILEEGRKFCLNLLRRDQKNLANLCSGQDDGEKRFSLGEWHSHDPIYLESAQSNIFWSIEELIPFSSHSLVIGKVYELNHSGDKDPLIYQDGDYE